VGVAGRIIGSLDATMNKKIFAVVLVVVALVVSGGVVQKRRSA
jgi:hypothetical protein